MTRWMLLFSCAGILLAGCDGEESVSTAPESSQPAAPGDAGTVPPPPPPGSGGPGVPAPPPPAPTSPPATGQGGADSLVQRYVALKREMVDNVRLVVDLLGTVNDEASARAAAPKLRQCASDFRRVAKGMKLAMASLSLQDLQRASAELQGSLRDDARLETRMFREIVRVAASPAGGTIRAEMNELLYALDSLSPGKRRSLERRIQRARGGR